MVHSIAAVRYEHSLWQREAETQLLPTLRDFGIALMAWRPLGAGFLTSIISALDPGDFRQANPRFAGANRAWNRQRFAPVMRLARELPPTPATLALV